jgi:hypothetical protein
VIERSVELSDDERDLLAHGLDHWRGPAHATDALARVMGFENVHALYRDGSRIARELRSGANVSGADLARALIATEFVFASDDYGAGWDWESVTELSDEDTIKRLREVQRKLIGVARLRETAAMAVEPSAVAGRDELVAFIAALAMSIAPTGRLGEQRPLALP